jgi:5'-nucleotidase / UDP-sugar diphosphatase
MVSRRFRILSGLAFAAMTALGAVSAVGCGQSAKAVPSAVCGKGGTCQVRVTFLHTADIHSRLLPYDLLVTQIDGDLGLGPTGQVSNVGGVARMATILDRERARADRVLHVDGGDCFQGAPIFNYFFGEPEIRAQSLLNVDAMVLANHEFDLGPLNIARQAQKWGSFPILAANYKWAPLDAPQSSLVGSVSEAYRIFDLQGVKVAVIGMANLSSLSSIYDQPNRLGIMPLRTRDVVQGYVDLLRPHVDLVVLDTHLGLDNDQEAIRNSTGVDIVFGSHNHVVINPPQQIQDCSADPRNPGWIWAVDKSSTFDPANPPKDELHPDPVNHPGEYKRPCKPRTVPLVHSGAFAKYVGRFDAIISNDPAEVSPTGDPNDYESVNGFEVISSTYQAFPVNSAVPKHPRLVQMLEPYERQLAYVADLDNIIGYAPTAARRNSGDGGDSALGNLVSQSIWLRLGVQTDFSLTNTTGIRQDLLPGPLTAEQVFNIFPFDNSITKMQLSGVEVQEMFDFVARRSASRGCSAQAQIAGARIRVNCGGCSRVVEVPCATNADCSGTSGAVCGSNGLCAIETRDACAEEVYIGSTARACGSDDDCADLVKNASGVDTRVVHRGQCLKGEGASEGRCLSPIRPTSVYELSTSTYLAGGGSGFRVLQRNTTQFDTKIQQRDALVDYIRQGKPCGWKTATENQSAGMVGCEKDTDCEAGFACACPGNAERKSSGGDAFTCSSAAGTCAAGKGVCVLAKCRDEVAVYRERRCAGSPNVESCRAKLDACTIGGESCKLLACVDEKMGAASDGRILAVGR